MPPLVAPIKPGIGTQVIACSLGISTWDSGPEERLGDSKKVLGTFASCFCHHQRHTQEIFLRTEHYSQRHWKLPERREQNSSLHVRHGQDRELPTSNLKKNNARSSPEPLGMCTRSKLHGLLPALGGISRQLALTWPPDSAGCAVRKSGGHLLISTILSMEHGSITPS